MNVFRFLIALAAVVAIGLVTVWQRLENVQLSYTLTQLREKKDKLEEYNRELEMELELNSKVNELLDRAGGWGLRLESTGMPIEDRLPYHDVTGDADNSSLSPRPENAGTSPGDRPDSNPPGGE